ncbi:uncharacterized protein PV09_09008 [Verruconis gallopava]|uniref:Pheromone-regulated membrane protein 6 n=1 Tax=Verruconis gallopava TaxID=253628 RepID=A0A0D1XAV2_9PEZI|nr:uncharacterized protein PV09_09008 [Verruconis gallopava]KIV99350.1 hypothetical protein PV09_09008 [Verruconis gallopava]
MGYFSGREERGEVQEQQKWDYITLSDFRGNSCGHFFSYLWLWILVFITIGVYVADTFTAVKLLVFNEWSSQVKPAIPFTVAKWIFSGCIILSWALAILAWINAIRVIRRGCVTDDYLNSTAVTLQSIRPGSGWKRFLVFAALTKSKKKVSWIAIFVYFQRQGCIRLLAAEGPRQVINALTLYSVGKATLIEPGKGEADRSGFDQFFYNLQVLSSEHRTQTIILSTMAFTLIIWVISMLLLALALVLYIIFLWHYIQNDTLTGFCRRKIETRLARIVKKKGDKELARQQRKWEKEERKRGSPTNTTSSSGPPTLSKQPTLPAIEGSLPSKNELFRSDSTITTSTLPPYSSQANTPAGEQPPPFGRAPTLPDVMRPNTAMSDRSVMSNAPLLSQASAMGYSDPGRPGPPSRSFTGSSQRSMTPNSMPGRPPLAPISTQTAGPRFPPPTRTGTGMSGRASPMSASNYTPLSAQSNRPLLAGQSPMSPYSARSQSPAPGMAYEMTPVDTRNGGGDYFSQGPQRAPTLPTLDAGTPASLLPGRRDVSAPIQPRSQPPSGPLQWTPNQRSATAPIPDHARGPIPRSNTTGPQGW